MDKKVLVIKIIGYALMFYSFFSMLIGMVNEEPISLIDVIIMMLGFMVMSMVNYAQHRK